MTDINQVSQALDSIDIDTTGLKLLPSCIIEKGLAKVVVDTSRGRRTAYADIRLGTIYIPADFTSVRDEEMLAVLRGLILHEVGHLMYSQELTKDKNNSDIPFSVMNAIEDGRIERKMCSNYAGARRILRKLYINMIPEWMEDIGEGKKKVKHRGKKKAVCVSGCDIRDVFLALAKCIYNQHRYSDAYEEEMVDLEIGVVGEKIYNEIKGIYDEAITVDTTGQILPYAKKIWEIIKKYWSDNKQDDDVCNGDEKSDNDNDDNDKERGKGKKSESEEDGEGDDDEEGDKDEEGVGSGENEDGDEGVDGSDSNQSDKNKEGNTGEDNEEVDGDWNGKHDIDSKRDDNIDGSELDDYAEEHSANNIVSEKVRQLLWKEKSENGCEYQYRCIKDYDKYTVLRATASSVSEYEKLYSSIRGQLASIMSTLTYSMRTLMENKKLRYSRRGKIDFARLADIAGGLSKDVYVNQRKGVEMDTAVMVIIDNSGSMVYVIRRVMRCVIALCHVMYYMNIKFSVIATHTTMRRVCKSLNIRPYALDCRIYKRFQDDFMQVKHCFGQWCCNGNNVDGEAIEYAANVLRGCAEKRKIIFSVTDGEPYCGSSYVPAARHLKDVCKKVRQSGVEVYSLAINTKNPEAYYGKEYCINLSNDIDIEGMRAMSKILFKGMINSNLELKN